MKLIVTGDYGFIGRHVSRLLIAKGHEVAGIDRARGVDNELSLMMTPPGYADGAEAIIHCAAHADVRDNWTNMLPLWNDNVLATWATLQVAAQLPIKSFVFVSTGAVYAPQLSPYAASKLSCEAWCRSYADRHGWALSIIRPAAVFGEGYHHGHVADFVDQAREMGRVKCLTRGDPKDALHVDDLAETLVACALHRTGVGPVYMAAEEQWGCRDTVRLMGVEATWTDEEMGWFGDTTGSVKGNRMIGVRSVKDGVRDALRGLGWTGGSR